MTRQELIRDIKGFSGSGLITRQQLANYIGKKDPHGVDHFLHGLQRIENKYYFIPDVADALISYGTNERGCC